MKRDKWTKITINANPTLSESICDFLIGVIGAGVQTNAHDEPDYGRITGYIEKPDITKEEIKIIREQLTVYLKELAEIFNLPVPELAITSIADEDWTKSWKIHFKPFEILPGLVIVPTWESYQLKESEKVITMDPGMAFGTGHHATTSLCLAFIKEHLVEKKEQKLLDVGTGTGILAMAALLFGAKKAVAIDNDPAAVSAAKKNAAINLLQDRMKASLAPLSSLDEKFDIVVANIVYDVLVLLAEDLTSTIRPGGCLILSGILSGDQVVNTVSVFKQKGFTLNSEKKLKEWSSLCFFYTDHMAGPDASASTQNAGHDCGKT